jgi:hypothetical protein
VVTAATEPADTRRAERLAAARNTLSEAGRLLREPRDPAVVEAAAEFEEASAGRRGELSSWDARRQRQQAATAPRTASAPKPAPTAATQSWVERQMRDLYRSVVEAVAALMDIDDAAAARITEAEQRLAALEAEVTALRQAAAEQAAPKPRRWWRADP